MPLEHRIRNGESVSSLALKYGMLENKIWEDSANKALRDKCGDPNLLIPGETIVIPDKQVKEEAGSTEQRHRFRKKIPSIQLVLKLSEDDEPRANIDYILEIDGQLFEGKTDGDGVLKQPLPANAKNGKLHIGEEEIDLQLSALEPVTTTLGLQKRLINLGYLSGSAGGKLDDATKSAIKAFQEAQGLRVTGDADQETQDKVKATYGC